MPTYEYECLACKHEFDFFQSMKDEPILKCPECDEDKLRRKIGTGAGIIFKGSGFYCTDYRSETYKKSSEKDSKPAEPAKTDAKSSDTAKPSNTGKTSDAGKAAPGGDKVKKAS